MYGQSAPLFCVLSQMIWSFWVSDGLCFPHWVMAISLSVPPLLFFPRCFILSDLKEQRVIIQLSDTQPCSHTTWDKHTSQDERCCPPLWLDDASARMEAQHKMSTWHGALSWVFPGWQLPTHIPLSTLCYLRSVSVSHVCGWLKGTYFVPVSFNDSDFYGKGVKSTACVVVGIGINTNDIPDLFF